MPLVQHALFDSRLDEFPGRGSFEGFLSTVRRISGNLVHIYPWILFGHHNSPKTIPHLSMDGDGLWPQMQYMVVVK